MQLFIFFTFEFFGRADVFTTSADDTFTEARKIFMINVFNRLNNFRPDVMSGVGTSTRGVLRVQTALEHFSKVGL